MIQSIEKGRKEDGNRSIADKIIKRLHDLSKTVQNNEGRWAWELLQNAKDSIAEFDDRTVSVQIEFDENHLIFRHNGVHFSEQDVRGIINQISSKEKQEGQETKNTGRFGTGFLTTNLLSKIVKVEGIVETDNEGFYKFKFPLNREGQTTEQLIPKIENAWAEFHKSVEAINADFNKNNFSTSFCYSLNSERQKEIARIGIKEFSKLIPFVLAFNSKIEIVEIVDKPLDKKISFKRDTEQNDDSIISISKIENGHEASILILYSSDNQVTIATEIEKIEKGYIVKNIKDIPSLFCDFPLIGSEDFYFPVIVNSFSFNPQTERDGIWLYGENDIEVEQNKRLIENAVELYKDLIEKIKERNFFDLHNLVETKIPKTNKSHFDENWYQSRIQKPLREFIIDTKIVEIENELMEKKAICKLWFPLKTYTKTVQSKIWQYAYDLSPSVVCKKDQIHSWSEKSWDGWKNLTYEVLIRTISKKENIQNLSLTLEIEEKETFTWLNSFYVLFKEENNNLQLFDEYSLIPNQKGVFKKKSEIYIDRINDKSLVHILQLLGHDWENILLHKEVLFGEYIPKAKKDIADKITEKLRGRNNFSNEEIKAISLLSEWFEANKRLGEELFFELYKNRAKLFMNTITDKENLYKVMRSKTDLAQLSSIAQAIENDSNLLNNLNKVEELSNLLLEFNAKDIAELKKILLVAQGITVNNPKIEITQDVLASLGVTSIEELEKALEDKNLAAQFAHISNPNVEMFLYAQRLISRAKSNILKHLEELPHYDCSEIDELATTVLGGIKKNGRNIYIVIRPSDNKEVILYYSSEKDTLDLADSELWIDNGIDSPKHLTLGRILKTTGINKIPV